MSIKNTEKFIGIGVEFTADENFTDKDWVYIDQHSPIDLNKNTKDFLEHLGVMAEHRGCSQKLISYLKYARDMGARWVFFTE
jgi:hypothetical protein